MSALGDLDDIIELGIEGFDKITDKGFDHLPDEAMHANFYHPRRLKSLKNLGRSKKNQDIQGPLSQQDDQDRDVNNRSDQQRGEYRPRTPKDSGSRSQPPYPTSEYDARPRNRNSGYDARPRARGDPPYPDPSYDTRPRSRGVQDSDYNARSQSRGPPNSDYNARSQPRGPPDSDYNTRPRPRDPPPYYVPAAAASQPSMNYRPNLYRSPSGYIDPPSPYASTTEDPDARERPRRRKKHRKHHRHHHHHRDGQNPDPRYRSVSPSRSRPGPPLRRASSLDAFDRPPRRSPSPSDSPSPSHQRRLTDLRKEGKRSLQHQFFSQSPQALGAGALGAIAGGWAAREAQVIRGSKMPGEGHKQGGAHPKGKDRKGERQGGHSWVVTLLGAAAGGLGANALVERSQERERKEREGWERRGSEGSAVGSGGGGGGKGGLKTDIKNKVVDWTNI